MSDRLGSALAKSLRRLWSIRRSRSANLIHFEADLNLGEMSKLLSCKHHDLSTLQKQLERMQTRQRHHGWCLSAARLSAGVVPNRALTPEAGFWATARSIASGTTVVS